MIQQQSTVECTEKNNVEITSEKQQDLKQSFVIYSNGKKTAPFFQTSKRDSSFRRYWPTEGGERTFRQGLTG